jgi:dephospho-CoA kinase
MLKIGITGGIGSGKTVVSKILESLHFPVFYSDHIAKEILNNNFEVRQRLIDLFDDRIFENDRLNKELLASIIFSDDHARLEVNRLVHPKVREAFDLFASNHNTSLVFNEAAILFETENNKFFDKVILVTAPEKLRIERVMKRDEISKEEVEARMGKQWDDSKKEPLADFVLVNDGKKPLLMEIERIVEQLIN